MTSPGRTGTHQGCEADILAQHVQNRAVGTLCLQTQTTGAPSQVVDGYAVQWRVTALTRTGGAPRDALARLSSARR